MLTVLRQTVAIYMPPSTMAEVELRENIFFDSTRIIPDVTGWLKHSSHRQLCNSTVTPFVNQA